MSEGEEKGKIEILFSDAVSKLSSSQNPTLHISHIQQEGEMREKKIKVKDDFFFSPELKNALQKIFPELHKKISQVEVKEDESEFEKTLFSRINKVSHYKREKISPQKQKYFFISSTSEPHKVLLSSWVYMITGMLPDDTPWISREKMQMLLSEVSANYRFPLTSVKSLSTGNVISALSEVVKLMCEGWILITENLESTAVAVLISYTAPKLKGKIEVRNKFQFSERVFPVEKAINPSSALNHTKRNNPTEGKIKVLCDFDGTITKKDVSVALLDKFTGGKWRDSVRSVVKGNIGSREAYMLIAPKIKGKSTDMKKFVRDFGEVEDGFPEFISFLKKEKGIEVEVVSDGFGFYIKEILSKYKMSLKYFSSELLWSPNGRISFSFPNRCDFCDLCATCKLRILRENHRYFKVFIGNGISDRCAVEEAEIIFAKSRLKEICTQKGLDFFPFSDFHDIKDVFERKTPKCIIIDFDGTLAWSSEGIIDAFKYTFRKIGRDMPENIAELIGLPLIECFRRVLKDEDISKKAVRIFRERYEKIFLKKTYLAPGAKETLKELKNLGYKTAVLSNKLGEKLRRLISHLGISEYIDIAVGEEDIKDKDGNTIMKPDPRTVYYIAEKLDVSPDEIVMLGDTEVDMMTALNSGVSFVALYSSSRPPSHFEEIWTKNLSSSQNGKEKFLYFISSFEGMINLARFFKLK